MPPSVMPHGVIKLKPLQSLREIQCQSVYRYPFFEVHADGTNLVFSTHTPGKPVRRLGANVEVGEPGDHGMLNACTVPSRTKPRFQQLMMG